MTGWEGFISTFKALVGIGILSCPSAYKDVGLVSAILSNIIIIFVFNLLYTQLIDVIQDYHNDIRTLSDITLKVLGLRAKILVDICILCGQLSVCTAFLKYFGAQMNQIACA